MKFTKYATFVIAISAFTSFQVEAGMRCANGKLVNKGDTTIEVALKCGEPFEKENIGEVKIKVKVKGEKKEEGKYVNLDRWTYVPEKGRFIKILDFHDGELIKIDNGQRVN